jgi:hypothetical protein
MTLKVFEMLPFAFRNEDIPTWKTTSSRARFLSGVDPILYDCCINSCCCYVGPHESLKQCPYCKAPRYNSEGKARRKFTYIPVIPRLVALFKNSDFAEKLQYRAGSDGTNTHQHVPGTVNDVFDGSHYRTLLQTRVTVDGKERPYNYFSDERDIALGLSTDGFAPFRKRKSTAWPLLLFLFNLPPEIRFLIQYLICLGVIPGPKKPKDYDSYSYPFVEELLALALGVKAYDSLRKELFLLRAYLLFVFGDIPAMSMVMRMKGHNGFRPCRMCNIQGLRIPNKKATTHYVPLDRSRHPLIRNSISATKVYDPKNLPMRTHEEIIRQGREVDSCVSSTVAEKLGTKYGVKGVPLLSYVPGIRFPQSFPYDFMHLIWENLIQNLVLLWTGEFKDVDEGTGSYQLDAKVWQAIGAATAASGSTIPYAFGARPPNVASDKTSCTADTWSFWTLYLSPVLLRRKFRDAKYYDHFIELVKLLNICLQFEYSEEDIETIRVGFIDWVKKYEK